MSELSAQRKKNISTKLDIETKKLREADIDLNSKDAPSKNLDKTLNKLTASRTPAKEMMADKEPANEKNYAIANGPNLKKLRISSAAEITPIVKKPDVFKATKPAASAVEEKTAAPKVALKTNTPISKTNEENAEPVIKSAIKPSIKTEIKTEMKPAIKQEVKAEMPSVNASQTSSKGYEKETSPLSVRKNAVEDAPQKPLKSFNYDLDEEEYQAEKSFKTNRAIHSASTIVASISSIGWLALSGFYVQDTMGWGNLFAQQPHLIGGFLAGILAPVAMLWMIVSFIQRGLDAKFYSGMATQGSSKFQLTDTNLSNDISKELSTLKNQAGHIAQGSKQMLRSMGQSKTSIQSELAAFEALSSKMEKHVAEMNKAVSGNNTGDSQLWDKKFEEFTAQTKRMEKILSQNPVSIDAEDGALNSIQSMLSKTESLESMMNQKAERLQTVLSALTNKLNRMEELEAQATKKLEAIDVSGQSTTENLEKTLSKLEAGRTQIANISKEMQETTEKLSLVSEEQTKGLDTVQADLKERIGALELTFDAPIKRIEKIVEDASNKNALINDTLEKRIQELVESGDKAVEKAHLIKENLRDQTKDLSGLVGQLTGFSKTTRSQIDGEIASLDKTMQAAMTKITEATREIKESAFEISESTQNTDKDITSLSKNISAQRTAIADDSREVFQNLKQFSGLLEENILGISAQCEAANATLSKTASKIIESADVVGPTCDKATEQINKTRERFDEMIETFDNKTSENLDRVKSINVVFDETLDNLETSAVRVSESLQESGGNLRLYVREIEKAGDTAVERMEEVGQAIKDQATDTGLQSDQAILKVQALQKSMTDQQNDLTAMISAAMTQIDEAGKQFTTRVDEIHESSDKAISNLDVMNNKVGSQQEQISEITEITGQQIEGIMERLKKEISSLTKTSSSALNTLNETGSAFAERNDAVKLNIEKSLESSQQYDARINKYLDRLSNLSERSNGKIEQTLEKLTSQIQGLEGAVELISVKAETTRELLEGETEHLAEVSIKASRLLEGAADSYKKQASMLLEASTEAEENISRIRDKDYRAQRESFFSGAKYLLESLHSLSIDLTRSIDGHIHEKSWKSYQAGDVAVFTRNIVQNRKNLPDTKMAEKYAEDHEFRTFVNRFIRQFEEIYTNAASSDHGDLMASAFATSDVGTLYQTLSDIIAHKSVITERSKRAA